MIRIDCHNDTALMLREHSSLNLLPEAHFDYQRFRQYLDVAFFAIFIHGIKYRDNPAGEFRRILALLRQDFSAQGDIDCLLWREQLDQADARKLALIVMEGAAPVGRGGCHLDEYFRRGLRAVGLTWNYSNAFGGAAMQGGRLTREGRELVWRCNELGVLVDAAHSSSATLADLLTWSRKPIIDSHTVCGALCPVFPRAVSDGELRGLAARGGVAGITFVRDFLGGPGDLDRLCEHIEYAVALIGSGHVALGGDFDGSTIHTQLAGVQFLPALYRRLRERGMAEDDLANVAGESVRRLLRQVLPARS